MVAKSSGDKEEIIQRQGATKELAAYSDFRETFGSPACSTKGRQATAKKLKSGRKHLPISARNGGAARYWESFPVNIVLAMLGVAGSFR